MPDDDPPSEYTIENAAPWLPDGLAGLRREAGDEGIRIVGVIVDRWFDGSQRYDGPGEAPLVARRASDDAATHTSTVTCNAKASAAAPPFWESLGFRSVDTDGITRRLDVMTSDGVPTKMDR